MDEESSEKAIKGWGNLDIDILETILHKHFSINDLTFVAHVCRGWREACQDPVIWYTLDLSHMKSDFIITRLEPYVYVNRRSDEKMTRILKVAMSLSKGNTKTLIFHHNLFLTDDMFTYTAKRCPNLRRLVLPAWERIKNTSICNALQSWENLESLTMSSIPDPKLVFSSIAKNCKNFRELKVMGPFDISFIENLVQLLPNLKVLSLRCTAIDRDDLIAILDQLKSLEVLNISHSYLGGAYIIPVYELDGVIMEKASRLKQFVTCMNRETCVMCQRTVNDKGSMRWFKYEEGLWKADEISSLHL